MVLTKYIPSYTVEDYRQWKGDWELWSGVPIAMTPSAKQPHQRITGNLYFQIRSALEQNGCENCEAFFELDWVVSKDTVFRPDLLVVCRHERSDYIDTTPTLVVEVLSESTRQRDLLFKRDHYEKLGVTYYLIVDPEKSDYQLLVNAEGGFKEAAQLCLELEQDCRVHLDASRIF